MNPHFSDLIALAALLLWPAIPLFWIPVHCVPRFFRRLGLRTYVLPLVTWLPVAFFAFRLRDVLLQYRIDLPLVANIIGAFLFASGAALQIWTLVLLTPRVITGMPEVMQAPARLVTAGPFGIVRHPTYISHTLMLLGLFLWTEVAALGVVTVIDALVVNVLVIPLEERELLGRFGKEYEEYRRKVPSRFLLLRRRRR